MENTGEASDKTKGIPFLDYAEDGQEEPSIGQSEEKAFREAMVEGLELGVEEREEEKRPIGRETVVKIEDADSPTGFRYEKTYKQAKVQIRKGVTRWVTQRDEKEIEGWWKARRGLIDQALFELAVGNKPGSVKALELVKKLTGELKEKPSSLTLNIVTPDELARRNLQALKKSEEFRASLAEEG